MTMSAEPKLTLDSKIAHLLAQKLSWDSIAEHCHVSIERVQEVATVGGYNEIQPAHERDHKHDLDRKELLARVHAAEDRYGSITDTPYTSDAMKEIHTVTMPKHSELPSYEVDKMIRNSYRITHSVEQTAKNMGFPIVRVAQVVDMMERELESYRKRNALKTQERKTLENRVIKLYKLGQPAKIIADTVGSSPSTVYGIVKKYKEGKL